MPQHARDAAHGARESYQQRVWKVSKALDRLALMCEQHHRQTKHVDGLPDWEVPPVAAGVRTRDSTEIPANFAWTQTKSSVSKALSSQSEFVTPAVDEEKVPVGEPTQESSELVEDHDSLEKRSEALRASTRDMMARLSISSTGSFPTRGRVTQESVQPIDMPAHVDLPKSHSRIVDSSGPSNEIAETARYFVGASLPSVPFTRVSTTAPPTFAHDTRANASANPNAAASRRPHALDPHRRRKVQFADHGRSYRGERSSKPSKDRAKPPARGTVGNGSPPRTTYQSTFRWPQREQLVEMMDRVGGQTAGGEVRYEPRRVFTADEAIRVAKEAAREFQPQKTHSNYEYAQQMSINQSNAKTAESIETGQIEHLSSNDDAFHDSEIAIPSVDRKQRSSDFASTQGKPSTCDIGVGTSPVFQVEVGTQTDPYKIARVVHVVGEAKSTAQSGHSGFCSHCGRGGDGSAQVEGKRLKASDPVPSSNKPPRQNRPISSVHRFNPIFANARYPPEPPTFRGKTTYSSTIGANRISRR